MNNPQTVEEALDDICRCDLEADIGSVLHSTIVGFIKDDRLAHKTALLEAIGNYDTKEHICGFNDGDCDCECFLAGLDTMTDIINKTFE